MKIVPIFVEGRWRRTSVPFGSDDDDEDEQQQQSENRQGAIGEEKKDESSKQVASTSATLDVDEEVPRLSSAPSLILSSQAPPSVFSCPQRMKTQW